MRKVLSFVLVLSLVLGSFGFAFAAPADVQDTSYETPVEVLMALGIVNGYEDGTYRPDNIVTRAEMAKLLIVALGLDELVGASKSSFSDMAGHWADSYVALAAAKGLIMGYPDGTFKPNATVSFNEAITMIVRTLGYTDAYANQIGGWPMGYLELAQDLDLTEDADASSTRGNIAQLIYNALTAQTVRILANQQGYFEKENTGKKLIARLGAEEKAAFPVTEADVYSKYTRADLSDYVYATVTAFTIKDDDKNDVIIAVDEVISKSIELTYNQDTGKLVDSNSKIWQTPATSTSVFLNGGETDWETATASETLKDKVVKVYAEKVNTGTRTFTNIQGVIAEAPTAGFRVTADQVEDIEDAIEDEEGEVFGIDLPVKSSKLDMNNIIVTGDADSLEDIQKDDIVYVYAGAKDDSPKRVKFEVSRGRTVTGDVTKLDGPFIFVDGARYGKASAALLDTFPTVSLKDNVTLYLGADGKVVDAKINAATAGKYAIVVATGAAVGMGDPQIKLYTYEDEQLVFNVAKFESADYKVANNAWVTAPAIGTVVEFSTNSSGKINDLVAVSGTTVTAIQYKEKSNLLGGVEVADNVVIFDVIDITDVDIVSSLTNNATYTAFVAKNPNDEYKVIAITAWGDHGAGDDVYFAVNGVASVLDDDDNPIKEVTGFVDGDEATDLTKTNSVSIAKGGLYLVEYSGGKITNATVASSAAISVIGRTVSAVATNDSWIELSNGIKYDMADELTVYVMDLKLNGAFNKFTVGSMADVDKGDYVYLYDSTDDDDENDGIDIVIVVDKKEEVLPADLN